jgi:carboxypeptidase C (cathepsin A)
MIYIIPLPFPYVGVGFSEATNDTPGPSHEDDVAADFDSFLQNFFRVFNGYETHVSSRVVSITS